MRPLPSKNARAHLLVYRMRGGGLHGFGLYGYGILSIFGNKLLHSALSKGKELAVNKAKELAGSLAEKAIGKVASRFTGSGAPTAGELKDAAAMAEQLPQGFANPLASVVGGKGLAVSKRKPAAARAQSAVAAESKAVKKQSAAQLKKERAALKRLEKAQSELEGMGLYMLGDNGRGPRRAPAQC